MLPEQRWHVDHVLPLRLGGGTFDESLLEPAHAACNMAAGASTVGSRTSRRRVSRIVAGQRPVSLVGSDTFPSLRPSSRTGSALPAETFTRTAPLFADEVGV